MHQERKEWTLQCTGQTTDRQMPTKLISHGSSSLMAVSVAAPVAIHLVQQEEQKKCTIVIELYAPAEERGRPLRRDFLGHGGTHNYCYYLTECVRSQCTMIRRIIMV